MHEIIKCSGCNKKMEFIKAINNGWRITPFSYICPDCSKKLKDRINKWVNSKEEKYNDYRK